VSPWTSKEGKVKRDDISFVAMITIMGMEVPIT
jgi:hypothetical protein